MAFSQSFCMGNETMKNIDKQIELNEESLSRRTRTRTFNSNANKSDLETIIIDDTSPIKTENMKQISTKPDEIYSSTLSLENGLSQYFDSDFVMKDNTINKPKEESNLTALFQDWSSQSFCLNKTDKKKIVSEKLNNEAEINFNNDISIGTIQKMFDQSDIIEKVNGGNKKMEHEVDANEISIGTIEKMFDQSDIIGNVNAGNKKIKHNVDSNEISIETIEKMFEQSNVAVKIHSGHKKMKHEVDSNEISIGTIEKMFDQSGIIEKVNAENKKMENEVDASEISVGTIEKMFDQSNIAEKINSGQVDANEISIGTIEKMFEQSNVAVKIHSGYTKMKDEVDSNDISIGTIEKMFDQSGIIEKVNAENKKMENEVDASEISIGTIEKMFDQSNIAEKINSESKKMEPDKSIELIEKIFKQNDTVVINKNQIVKQSLSFDTDIFENLNESGNDCLNNPISNENLSDISFSEKQSQWEESNEFNLCVTLDESILEIKNDNIRNETIIIEDNVTLTENVFLDNSLNISIHGSESFIFDEMERSKGKLLESLIIEEEEIVSQKHIIKEKEEQKLISQNSQQKKSLEFESNKNLCLMSSWGLPTLILNEYHKKGIKEMFAWQSECLSNQKILFESANLVYLAPTSSGKTLVSEILLIKNIVENKKKALMILPFISVVREKMYYLQDLLTSAGYYVEGFFGGYTSSRNFERIDVAVCTIEKANSIINKLLEQNKLEDIGIVIVDEIHLISDPSRGYILELLLAKILFMRKKYNLKIQIITMSATLPNLYLLKNWLNAEFYSTDFRPVELREMIKINNCIYDNQLNLIRKLDNKFLNGLTKDQDNVGQLCIETILEGCSVIIFCPSKDWCETLCLHLAELIYKIGKSDLEISDKLREKIDMNKLEETKFQLKNSTAGLDSVLKKTISYGCAFHHAGLTSDERDIIESEFKLGSIKIIVATSTLSSGVNLPARRVIIRTPLFGGKIMNSLTYKQMIGRAGRTGKDTLGESILICTEATTNTGKQLINSKLGPISSCLDIENNVNLKRALLEIIASGVASTKNDLEIFSKCTLLSTEMSDKGIDFIQKNNENKTEAEENIKDPITRSIEFLIEYEFIRLQLNTDTNEMIYISTRLGNACLSSSMPPNDGFLLFTELQKARQCFVLETDLHAIYLVTPYSVCYQMQNIDWLEYLDIWEKLPQSMKRVGELVGIKDSFLVKAMRGHTKLDYKLLQIHKRFYTALALQELINEIPINNVALKYKCSRGLLQSLQQMSSTFAGIVTSFSNSLNWIMLGNIVTNFKDRLYFGINHDLMDLMRIQNLTSLRARALFNNNIKTLIDLANANILTIENILYNCLSFDSIKKRDNEYDFDVIQRNNIRNLYVTGKSGITVKEAAALLITDAQKYLENALGVENVNWIRNEEKKEIEMETNNLINIKNNKRHSDESLSTNTDVSPPKIRSIENQQEQKIEKENNLFESSISEIIIIDNKNESLDEIMNSQQNTNDTKISQNQSSRILRSKNQINDGLNLIHSTAKKKFNKISDDQQNNKSILLNSSIHIFDKNKEERNNVFLNELNIVDICKNQLLFMKFKEIINQQTEISLSIGLEKLMKSNIKIGENLLTKQFNENQLNDENKKNCIYESHSFISGISIGFDDNIIYFLDLQDNLIELNEKLNFLKLLFERDNLIIKMYDVKEQCLILIKTIPIITRISCKFQDPKIANWLLQPEVDGSLESMGTQYAPETIGIIKYAGKSAIYSGVGINYTSSINGKYRSSIECCATKHILKGQEEILKNLGNGDIYKYFQLTEMPIQISLLKMELNGFPLIEDDTIELIKTLKIIIKDVERKIYELNGRKFNLSSSSEIAKAIGIQNKTNKKCSITKEILEKINSPISNLIHQYRKLSATLNKTIIPLIKNISNNRIYGKNITFTATGRISMHEPNLQNVAKDFETFINDSDVRHISCRNIFKTNTKRYFISADFCQLELRILTHLSQDKILLNIMNTDDDVFKLIATKWYKCNELNVTNLMRQNTKQIIYGIIYGMGIKSLAETLNTDELTVNTFVEQFHQTYPGIRIYTEKIIKEAKEKEYVETITGRRRYLPNINSDDKQLKGQAERQAINTIIQGTGADITKSAILRMERNLKKYQQKLNFNPNEIKTNHTNDIDLVLHLHDELIYEVPLDNYKNIGRILKYSMENCVKLTIPLRVKVKAGNTWGSLNEIHV